MKTDRHVEFIEAIKAGSLAKVRSLLTKDPSLTETHDENGVSALLLAVYCGQDDIVRLLREHRVQMDLFEAAALGDTARLSQLLQQHPAQVNAYAPDGFTPLCLAAFFGRPEALTLLLDHGAAVNQATKNPMEVHPLHSALAHPNPALRMTMAEVLLSRGADVHTRQHGGWTALHQAADHGQKDLVRLLLRHGADVHAKSDDDRTAGAMAGSKGHSEVAAILRPMEAAHV